jgi:hypothetical protein
MTSGPEMHAYAQEAGDSSDWDIAHWGEPHRMTHEQLSQQYKMRCNELIDATYERTELERLRNLEEERLSQATSELFSQFVAVLDRYAKHECGKLHDKGSTCTCGLDACREAIEKRITQEAE